MGNNYNIFVINPGSTSTKIAFYCNQQEVLTKNLFHPEEELRRFSNIQAQLLYRTKLIKEALASWEMTPGDFDAFVGRGGGTVSVHSGVYAVTPLLVRHAAMGIPGQHPAQLAPQICAQLSAETGRPSFVVDSEDMDEFDDVSRITGLRGLYRAGRIHALNHKAVARRYCEENGLEYEDIRLVVCHLGGGISVAAHRCGHIVDANDCINGEGPMSPTRAGNLPTIPLIKLCSDGKRGDELIRMLNQRSGILSHLGTADMREVEERIARGDAYASLVYNAMIYQTAKAIGACASALKGPPCAIIVTGGLANSRILLNTLREYIEWIAPVVVYPGEFEMNALAAGAFQALTGRTTIQEYTGIPVWSGFSEE